MQSNEVFSMGGIAPIFTPFGPSCRKNRPYPPAEQMPMERANGTVIPGRRTGRKDLVRKILLTPPGTTQIPRKKQEGSYR